MLNANTVQRYIDDNSGVGTFLLKDSGAGNFISTWDMGALAQPTTGQLDTIATTLADEDLATEERAWRDAELKASDMWGLSDRTMTTAMTTFRNDLRDMPTLTGFPNTHTRPIKP